MGRIIGSVVVGYIVIFIAVFVGLTGAWMILGADGAFQPGTFAVSGAWIGASIVVSLIAAFLGGLAARRIARDRRGPIALAAVLVLLGIAGAIPAFMSDPAAVATREGAVGMMEAIAAARTPTWLMLLNPVLGALGVLIGGGVIGAKGSEAQAAPTAA